MRLEPFTKALADQTRLRILLLLTQGTERCVCELTQALDLPQPKISRHLAVLRESGLLQDRKAGLWVYYRLHADLPAWAIQVLGSLREASHDEAIYQTDLQRLADSKPIELSCL